jgi:hypothetical protein
VLDALSKQSSEVLAAGAMRVAAAMYQFELRTLIHPQNGIGDVTRLVCDLEQTRPSRHIDFCQLL